MASKVVTVNRKLHRHQPEHASSGKRRRVKPSGQPRSSSAAQRFLQEVDRQDTGAEQINQALQQLEKVIQQNASAAEEMASTTEELTGQADQLMSALGFFRTGDNGRAPAVRPASVKPAKQIDSSVAPKAKKANGQSVATPGPKPNGNLGLNLKLHESSNELDGEFERF